jgi:predicted DNA-binding transcriptional regulator YafY
VGATLVTFRYRNHRGEEATRRVRPVRLWLGSTAHHPEPQWFVEGYCIDRQATRDFAMSGMLGPWPVIDPQVREALPGPGERCVLVPALPAGAAT